MLLVWEGDGEKGNEADFAAANLYCTSLLLRLCAGDGRGWALTMSSSIFAVPLLWLPAAKEEEEDKERCTNSPLLLLGLLAVLLLFCGSAS